MAKHSMQRFSALALALGLFGASTARAQSVSIGPDSTIVRKFDHSNLDISRRYWVNQYDCLNQDVLTFQATLVGNYLGLNLEVWAGTSKCTDLTARTAGSAATCWRVYLQPAAVPVQSVPINARNIAAHNPPTGAQDAPVVLPEPSVCDGTTGAQAISLYFMITNSLGELQGTSAVWASGGYDTAAPAPPTGMHADGGESMIHFSWTRSADSDILGYNLYCDTGGSTRPDSGLSGASFEPHFGFLALDASLGAGGALGSGGAFGAGGVLGAGGFGGLGGAGGTAAIVDAGKSDAATVKDAAAANLGSCSTSTRVPTIMVPGQAAPSSLFCGYVAGITASTGSAKGLVNNTPYVVSMAAVDRVGNIGVLSNLDCATPIEITDFFELYKNYGGHGGGGFCSMSRRQRPGGFALSALSLSVFGAALRRRRRAHLKRDTSLRAHSR
jgi:hypothetical protein